MVSVNFKPNGLLIRDVFESLSVKIRQMSEHTIEYAFVSWIYPNSREVKMPALPQEWAANNYSHVAQLAFLMEISFESFSDQLPMLIDGLQRTATRSPIMVGVGPAAFYNDAVALLGLALGAKRIGGGVKKDIGKWMLSFVPKAAENLPGWKQVTMAAALKLLDERVINYDTNQAPETVLAINSRGIDVSLNVDLDLVYKAICNSAIKDNADIALIAAQLQSIDYLINHLPLFSLNKPTISQVASLLNNLPAAFRRWVWEDAAKTKTSSIQKWDIQNEYHVQSLLYFILAPLFPDIEDEFYLETTGQLNPRADIGLPSLNLIIEVKYLRPAKNFQHMLEEIAADATLYFKNESVYQDKYTQMLVFLWDDSNRTQEHNVFMSGVRTFNRVIDVVVITRPGIINRSTLIPIKPTKK